jgi:MFS family permease
MTTTTPKLVKRSIGYLLGMCIMMLGANIVWVAYNSIILPTLVQMNPNVPVNMRAPLAGLIVFFGTLIAVIVSILAGIISDHTTSRWGRRTPSLLIGSILSLPVIALAAIFFPPAIGIIAISFIGMQLFTNIANGAWWPLLVDTVPEEQRGMASGFQGIMTLIGAALGTVLISELVKRSRIDLALWVIGIVMLVSGVITVLVIRKKDTPAAVSEKRSIFQYMGDMFRVRTRVPVFLWVVVGSTLTNMGINSLQVFAIYFFQVYFPKNFPTVESAAGGFQIMGAIAILFTMLSAVLSGILSDKIGRRRVILIGALLSAVTTFGMALSNNFVVFLIMAAIRSIATGPIVAVIPALTGDLAPKEEAGQYMAYANLGTGLSGALSALFFGVILTEMNHTGFLVVFIISSLLFLAGAAIFAWMVTQKKLDERLKKTT